MCDRNEVFAALCSGMAHHSSDSVQQLTQKDKVLWKGASRGSVQEQGLSTPSVTLVSLQIGFVLVNEGERKEEKKAHEQEKGKKKTVLLWLMSGSPPATQAMFMPSGVGSNLGWLCVFFFLILLSPHPLFSLSLFFNASLLADTGPKYWLKTKASGRHLGPCS